MVKVVPLPGCFAHRGGRHAGGNAMREAYADSSPSFRRWRGRRQDSASCGSRDCSAMAAAAADEDATPARLEEPQRLEARVAAAADDDMVVERDAHGRKRLGDDARHVDVGA